MSTLEFVLVVVVAGLIVVVGSQQYVIHQIHVTNDFQNKSIENVNDSVDNLNTAVDNINGSVRSINGSIDSLLSINRLKR